MAWSELGVHPQNGPHKGVFAPYTLLGLHTYIHVYIFITVYIYNGSSGPEGVSAPCCISKLPASELFAAVSDCDRRHADADPHDHLTGGRDIKGCKRCSKSLALAPAALKEQLR